MTRILLLLCLLGFSSAFQLATTRAGRLAHCGSLHGLQASIADSEPEPRISPEGIERYRERQRLKLHGKPLSVWSESTDRKVSGEDHVPVPPTGDQRAAADALFDKVLRDDDLPSGFGEGLDDIMGI